MQQTVPGRFLARLRGEGRLDQPAPGDLVSVWYSPYAVFLAAWLTPSPETATSGQSPHVSYGYTKLDHLPSRVHRGYDAGAATRKELRAGRPDLCGEP